MADNNAPLSIEGAMGMLIEKNSAAPKADNSEPAPASSPGTGDAAAEPEKKDSAPASEPDKAPADEGKQDTPEGNQGETKDDAETGDALPSIDAPASWKTEEKAVWDSLPREAQEAIARREQDRTTELRKLQNQTADQRKAQDAELARLKTLSSELSQHVDDQLNELARDFPDLRSDADVVALATQDPARYTIFQARLMQFQAKATAAQRANSELVRRSESERSEQLTKARDALYDAFPKWKDDPTLARKEITELQDYVVQTFKVDEQAARQAFDPVLYQLAHKAMLYDRAQTKKDAAVERQPPRVVKPGAAHPDPKAAAKETARLNQLNKLQKSGDIEDARGLLRI